MTFKNSVKILFSNFNIVWKMFFYFLIFFLCSAVLMYLCVKPVVDMVDAAGFFARFMGIYTDFLSSLNLTALFDSVAGLADEVLIFMGENLSRLYLSFVGAGLVFCFFNVVVTNLTSMACCNSLHLYMGSLARQGFFSSLSENFGKNLKLQIVNYFVSLPINALGIVLLLLDLKLFNISWAVSLLNVFILVIGFVLFMSLKLALFSAWVPTTVILNYGIFKSLRVSLKTSLRRFNKIYGSAIGVVLTLICVNVIMVLCSFMVGLLISIPISILLVNVYGMVVTYEGQGMRFYVDIYNVITPKKRECGDKLKDMMYIV